MLNQKGQQRALSDAILAACLRGDVHGRELSGEGSVAIGDPVRVLRHSASPEQAST